MSTRDRDDEEREDARAQRLLLIVWQKLRNLHFVPPYPRPPFSARDPPTNQPLEKKWAAVTLRFSHFLRPRVFGLIFFNPPRKRLLTYATPNADNPSHLGPTNPLPSHRTFFPTTGLCFLFALYFPRRITEYQDQNCFGEKQKISISAWMGHYISDQQSF